MNLIRNRVFKQVRNEILDCTLMPGVELRESELAKRYGVSKSPIRDAMQKLEFEGLVEIEPRRGLRVRPISVKDAADILELRVILEAGAIKKIVAAATDEELRRLDAFRTADRRSIETFAEYNRGFHIGLVELSGNRRLAEEMRRAMEFYKRLCLVSLAAIPGEDGFREPLADHVAIIDAIQARRASLAIRLAARHVEKSRAQIMRGIGSRPIID